MWGVKLISKFYFCQSKKENQKKTKGRQKEDKRKTEQKEKEDKRYTKREKRERETKGNTTFHHPGGHRGFKQHLRK